MAGITDISEIRRIWRWQNFKPEEFRCKGTGKYLIVPKFMDRLQRVRNRMLMPLIITSGYRAPEHNAKVSSTGTTGPHTTGRAVDIAIRGSDALRLIAIAYEEHFLGIGVNQKGASRFIHLDDLDNSPKSPRPTIWSY